MSKYFLDSFVKDLREEIGLTQLQFAEKLGVGFSTLKMAELGTTSIPQKDFLSALANSCATLGFSDIYKCFKAKTSRLL